MMEFLKLYLNSLSMQELKSQWISEPTTFVVVHWKIGILFNQLIVQTHQNLLKCFVVAISLVPIFLHPQSVFSISSLEHTNKNILINFTAAFGFLLNDNGPLGISKGLAPSLCPPDSVLPSSPVSLCRRLGGLREVLVLGRDRCAGEPTLVASSSCLEKNISGRPFCRTSSRRRETPRISPFTTCLSTQSPTQG